MAKFIMTCTQAVLSLLLVSPCTNVGGASTELDIAAALASPQRSETDRARDALRKPDQVLDFFEIKPGMRVLDLFSGGGYYTELLSLVVGPTGSVVSHNNQAYVDYEGDQITARYSESRLQNVEQVVAEADDLQLPDAGFDAVLAILTWHDFYYSDASFNWHEIDEAALVRKLCSATKPGAVLGIIDHVAMAGADPRKAGQELHRVDPSRIKQDLEGSCFEFVAEAKFLRNPADQLDKVAMDPAVRGKTDQVIYKFRRN